MNFELMLMILYLGAIAFAACSKRPGSNDQRPWEKRP